MLDYNREYNLVWALIIIILLVASACQPKSKESKPPNILFIGIDDLRPELGCYGSDIAVTPHMDAFAKQGLLFENAYCQQAICGPSRASILTGLRPESSGIYHNYVKIRALNPDIVTLPQHFVANGYEAAYCGKIFHHGDRDDEKSWSREPALESDHMKGIPRFKKWANEENKLATQSTLKEMLDKYGAVARLGLAMGPSYEMADVPDQTYADGYNTDLAIATMKELQKGSKPFFFRLGI